jgi:hypothetical protein
MDRRMQSTPKAIATQRGMALTLSEAEPGPRRPCQGTGAEAQPDYAGRTQKRTQEALSITPPDPVRTARIRYWPDCVKGLDGQADTTELGSSSEASQLVEVLSGRLISTVASEKPERGSASPARLITRAIWSAGWSPTRYGPKDMIILSRLLPR